MRRRLTIKKADKPKQQNVSNVTNVTKSIYHVVMKEPTFMVVRNTPGFDLGFKSAREYANGIMDLELAKRTANLEKECDRRIHLFKKIVDEIICENDEKKAIIIQKKFVDLKSKVSTDWLVKHWAALVKISDGGEFKDWQEYSFYKNARISRIRAYSLLVIERKCLKDELNLEFDGMMYLHQSVQSDDYDAGSWLIVHKSSYLKYMAYCMGLNINKYIMEHETIKGMNIMGFDKMQSDIGNNGFSIISDVFGDICFKEKKDCKHFIDKGYLFPFWSRVDDEVFYQNYLLNIEEMTLNAMDHYHQMITDDFAPYII